MIINIKFSLKNIRSKNNIMILKWLIFYDFMILNFYDLDKKKINKNNSLRKLINQFYVISSS